MYILSLFSLFVSTHSCFCVLSFVLFFNPRTKQRVKKYYAALKPVLDEWKVATFRNSSQQNPAYLKFNVFAPTLPTTLIRQPSIEEWRIALHICHRVTLINAKRQTINNNPSKIVLVESQLIVKVRSWYNAMDAHSSNAALNVNATVHVLINFTLTDPYPSGGGSSLGRVLNVTVRAGGMRTVTLLLGTRLHRSCRSYYRLHTVTVRVELDFYRALGHGRGRRPDGPLPGETVFLQGGVRVVGPHGITRCWLRPHPRPQPRLRPSRSAHVSVLRRLLSETQIQFSSVQFTNSMKQEWLLAL